MEPIMYIIILSAFKKAFLYRSIITVKNNKKTTITTTKTKFAKNL